MNGRKRLVYFTTSSALSQSLTLATTVLVTHLFSPAQTGEYMFVVAASTALLPFCVLRMDYDLASKVGVSKSSKPFIQSLMLAITLCTFICLLASASILVLGNFPLSILIMIAQIWIITLLQISIALFIALLLYRNETKLISKNSILQSFISNACQFFLGIVSSNPLALLAGFIVGRLYSLRDLVCAAKIEIKSIEISIKDLTTIFYNRRHLFIPGAVDALFIAIPLIVVALNGGYAGLGLFGFAQSLILAPITLFTGALYSTLLTQNKKHSDSFAKNTSIDYHKNIDISLKLIPLTLILVVVEAIAGRLLIDNISGPEWKNGKDYFLILLLPLALQVFTIPTSIYHWKYNKWSQYTYIVLFALVVSVTMTLTSLFYLDFSWITCIGIFHLSKNICLIPLLFVSMKYSFKRN